MFPHNFISVYNGLSKETCFDETTLLLTSRTSINISLKWELPATAQPWNSALNHLIPCKYDDNELKIPYYVLRKVP